MSILTFILVLLIVSVHLLISRFRFVSAEKGYNWLSLTSGIAIGYVFLHLFPDIADARIRYGSMEGLQGVLGGHLFTITLIGLLFYYGIDRASDLIGTSIEGRQRSRTEKINISIHASGYAFYNFMIGYLIVNLPRPGVVPVLMITVVLALHFIGLDYHFRQLHQAFYDRWLRWLFAGSLLLGWFVGLLLGLSTFAKAVAFAFLAGAMIINTIKEELPENNDVRYIPFLTGVTFLFVVELLLERYFPKLY